jgi:hypothetical protein
LRAFFAFFLIYSSASGESGKGLNRELPFIGYIPNFQKTMQTITLIMAGTYNEENSYQPKKANPNQTFGCPKKVPANYRYTHGFCP